jgi:hypothetical protein
MMRRLWLLLAVLVAFSTQVFAQQIAISPIAMSGGSVALSYPIGQSHIPLILAPNGTVATNGTVTLGTALPTTYSGGAYVYFPSGAVTTPAGPGWYWVVFSSTTVGQVYQTQYTSGTPAIPNSPVAAVGSNSAYTQTTSAVTGYSLSIPGGAIGVNDQIRVSLVYSLANNANSKTTTAQYGGSSFWGNTYSTYAGVGATPTMANRGVATAQIGSPLGANGVGGSGTTAQMLSINSLNTQNMSITLQIAAATDYFTLENILVEQIKGVP